MARPAAAVARQVKGAGGRSASHNVDVAMLLPSNAEAGFTNQTFSGTVSASYAPAEYTDRTTGKTKRRQTVIISDASGSIALTLFEDQVGLYGPRLCTGATVTVKDATVKETPEQYVRSQGRVGATVNPRTVLSFP